MAAQARIPAPCDEFAIGVCVEDPPLEDCCGIIPCCICFKWTEEGDEEPKFTGLACWDNTTRRWRTVLGGTTIEYIIRRIAPATPYDTGCEARVEVGGDIVYTAILCDESGVSCTNPGGSVEIPLVYGGPSGTLEWGREDLVYTPLALGRAFCSGCDCVCNQVCITATRSDTTETVDCQCDPVTEIAGYDLCTFCWEEVTLQFEGCLQDPPPPPFTVQACIVQFIEYGEELGCDPPRCAISISVDGYEVDLIPINGQCPIIDVSTEFLDEDGCLRTIRVQCRRCGKCQGVPPCPACCLDPAPPTFYIYFIDGPTGTELCECLLGTVVALPYCKSTSITLPEECEHIYVSDPVAACPEGVTGPLIFRWLCASGGEDMEVYRAGTPPVGPDDCDDLNGEPKIIPALDPGILPSDCDVPIFYYRMDGDFDAFLEDVCEGADVGDVDIILCVSLIPPPGGP